eukprot:8335349-Pyramimonas_sp.AAC.1
MGTVYHGLQSDEQILMGTKILDHERGRVRDVRPQGPRKITSTVLGLLGLERNIHLAVQDAIIQPPDR